MQILVDFIERHKNLVHPSISVLSRAHEMYDNYMSFFPHIGTWSHLPDGFDRWCAMHYLWLFHLLRRNRNLPFKPSLADEAAHPRHNFKTHRIASHAFAMLQKELSLSLTLHIEKRS